MDSKKIISQMTLAEKASLLSGKGNFTTQDVSRLGIPSITLADGPHGLRRQAEESDHLGLNESLKATCFPTAATIANSWNEELLTEMGRCLAEEAKAQEVSILLGPGLNIKRSPLGGRNFEYFSEDPYLSGKLAAAMTRGVQEKGVGACPKHLAANSQETLRMHSDSVVDERALREIYLTGFEIAVKEGKPLCLMSSYNRLNGTYTNESKWLLQDLLRDEWGFDGIVVSDWGGSDERVQGLIAGNQLEMPGTRGQSTAEIMEAVQNGTISQELLDQRVAEYLSVLDRCAPKEAAAPFDIEAHHALARHAAEESLVLLKNEGNILPLKAETKVALIGELAEKPRYQGAGSSRVNVTKLDTVKDLISQSFPNCLGYQPGYCCNDAKQRENSEERYNAALALARQSEVILLFLGLDDTSESEGRDRVHMQLQTQQMELFERLMQLNKPIVLVLAGGSPFELPHSKICPAVLHSYLAGQAGAGAILDALTGKINPSGKLAESWPYLVEETPCAHYFPGREKTAEYRESIFVGYRYYLTSGRQVHWPFGYGLSYTSFSYEDLKIDEQGLSFKLTNTGACAGAEIWQLYISLPESQFFRPRRELKGFGKVRLEAGESQVVRFAFNDYSFRYYDIESQKFEIEGGDYQIEIGRSSAETALKGKLRKSGTKRLSPYRDQQLPSYRNAAVTNVPDAEFQTLLGRPIPPAGWDRTADLERNDTFSQLVYAKSFWGRKVYKILSRKKKEAEEKNEINMNVLFVYNMTFRGLEKLAASDFNRAMTDALLLLFNGHFFKGLIRLLRGRRKLKKERSAVQAQGAKAGEPQQTSAGPAS